jgi:hypothetical protein
MPEDIDETVKGQTKRKVETHKVFRRRIWSSRKGKHGDSFSIGVSYHISFDVNELHV